MKDSEVCAASRRVCGYNSTSGHLGTANLRVIMRTYQGHKRNKGGGKAEVGPLGYNGYYCSHGGGRLNQ